MYDVLKIILFSGISGITVFLGGILAKVYLAKFKNYTYKVEINHFITAFGGGIILSALALVLIPKGMEELSVLPTGILFILGSIVFLILDRYLAQKGGKMSQLLAMLMDFIPEAIALGAIFATDTQTGTLLAIFIGMQNLPESFNSYQDLTESGYNSQRALIILFLLSFSGIVGALIGYYFLQNQPEITSGLMLFASGGILYLIFEDIAPSAKMDKKWLPAFGANIGFLIGIIGEKLIGG